MSLDCPLNKTYYSRDTQSEVARLLLFEQYV
jgi:hypothetical protein